MKKFMSDSEIIYQLMSEGFKDDNTFSLCPKHYALIGVCSERSKNKETLYDPEFEDLGEIELKLMDKQSFHEFFNENSNRLVFQGLHKLSPIVSINKLNNLEENITTGNSIPIVGNEPSEVKTQFTQKKISDIISEIGSMSKDDYLKLHKEAVKRQDKMDKEFVMLHEGASKEDDDFFVGAVETKKQYEEDKIIKNSN